MFGIRQTEVFYYDQGSPAQKVVIDLSKDFQGIGSDWRLWCLFNINKKKRVLLPGCWKHATRKFTVALKKEKAGAEYAFEQISMIYFVKTMADEQGLDAW